MRWGSEQSKIGIKLHRPLRDEQPARDRRLPLGGDPRGAPGRVHGGIGEGERRRGCRRVCEVCWEFDERVGAFSSTRFENGKRFVFLHS